MAQPVGKQLELDVRNIGGIDETSVTFSSGLTVLAGRNATNRTSFLQSIMAACGSDQVTLKGDADEGHVELTIGDETYTRTLERTNGGIRSHGEPYLEETTEADLFAFLLESNEARRAVARTDDLRDLVMRPVDTDAINAEIDRLTAEKQTVTDELDELESLKREVPALEEKRQRLRTELEEKRAELAELKDDRESLDVSVEESREEKSELESKLGELQDARADLETAQYELETDRETLETLREERDDLEADLAALSETPQGEIAEIDADISRLRERKRDLEGEASEIQNLIQFNEEMLEGATDSPVADLEDDSGGSVTDDLLADAEVTCWTCGSTVDREKIESTVDRLRELHRSTLEESRSIQAEIDELQTEKRDLTDQQRERDQLERRLRDVEREIESTADAIETGKTTVADLEETVETLEADVEELRSEDHSEILELQTEINQLEFEISQTESDLESVEDEIEAIERQLENREELQTRREEITDQLTELRTRIDRLEREVVEGFNEHMDTVLENLAYTNLDRIWLERTEREVREGRRTVSKTAFTLHVIRTTDAGTTYEDTVDHLSESEREVTGLVFALAGYLAHEVYESMPFMLLDSLEAIDAERIDALLEYFREYADTLVVALLPEDAEAISQPHERVTEI